ncbi:hypothetical protein MTR67_043222 [Solanum verrucosum]|uniref:Uncharacterized protein n=1 Tax=Solanum verrucosum TaxID=315347 RepID=A0AAF0UP09_SOLVR|nr:hypothetical protein MTR67_043222 [Solanum verrucosum]
MTTQGAFSSGIEGDQDDQGAPPQAPQDSVDPLTIKRNPPEGRSRKLERVRSEYSNLGPMDMVVLNFNKGFLDKVPPRFSKEKVSYPKSQGKGSGSLFPTCAWYGKSHEGKANVVGDALSRLSMGSVAHVKEETKELVRDVHRLARLGV